MVNMSKEKPEGVGKLADKLMSLFLAMWKEGHGVKMHEVKVDGKPVLMHSYISNKGKNDERYTIVIQKKGKGVNDVKSDNPKA